MTNVIWIYKYYPLIYIAKKKCKIFYKDLIKYMNDTGFYTKDDYITINKWNSIIFEDKYGGKIIIEILPYSLKLNNKNEISTLRVINYFKVLS